MKMFSSLTTFLNFLGWIVSVFRGRYSVTQSGGAILPLAIAGLFGTSLIAVPLLDRSITSLEATKESSSVQGLDAEAAAWYAIHRLRHDPTIHSEFSGSPPTTTFQFRGADITVVGVEPPDNSGIIMSMTVTPNRALPNTPTTVTYTIIIKNDDLQAHDILRIEADPAGSYGPSYVDASTTGLTTVEPSTSGNRFTWMPLTAVTIDPFGAELSMSWDMIVDEGEGNYWMDSELRIDGVGDIEGLTEANVLVAPPNDIVVSASVNPVVVEAGDNETFSYVITIENTGLIDYDISDIKFWATKDLDVDIGSSAGVSSLDPQRNSDIRSNKRWEWTWGGLDEDLDTGQQLTQVFDATGSLKPGTWFVEAGVKTEEGEGNGQDVDATSSSASPIKAVRVYEINVDYFGSILDVDALIDNNGVQVLNWVE